MNWHHVATDRPKVQRPTIASNCHPLAAPANSRASSCIRDSVGRNPRENLQVTLGDLCLLEPQAAILELVTPRLASRRRLDDVPVDTERVDVHKSSTRRWCVTSSCRRGVSQSLQASSDPTQRRTTSRQRAEPGRETKWSPSVARTNMGAPEWFFRTRRRLPSCRRHWALVRWAEPQKKCTSASSFCGNNPLHPQWPQTW